MEKPIKMQAAAVATRLFLSIILYAVLAVAPAHAQQTIINVPSVDQTKEGRTFFLHESQLRDWGGNSFWQTTHFFTHGVTNRLEVAATFYNIGVPAAPNQAVGIGWKTAQPIPGERFAEWELKVGGGQMVQFNLRDSGVGLWSYGQTSIRVPGLGLRLMAGISHGPREVFGQNTTHAIASFEQPLKGLGDVIGGGFGKVVGEMTLLGEWWSGDHELADFVPGLNWHGKDGSVVIVGYKLSNVPGTETDAIIIEIGKTF